MTHKPYKRHPSYGTVLFTRMSGSPTKLFGSAIKHHHTTIRLSIHEASYTHDLGRDWIHGDLGAIVEVEMSAVQFSELLTTMNCGSGIPCTIRRRMNDAGEQVIIKDPPDGDGIEAERARNYFRETMEKLAGRLGELTKKVEITLAKKTIAKKDRESLRKVTDGIVQDVRANFPFVAEQFQKAVDKVVSAAKAEVDAFITRAVTQTGLKALQEQNADTFIDADVGDARQLMPGDEE